ncbi:TonB-dependent receptor [Motilimonas cestriensis]|uniref:TonB-dependent receptor n=1 Tax=Motilimonas cestriensis TaxID=2742685 RepID=UPI003DA2257A
MNITTKKTLIALAMSSIVPFAAFAQSEQGQTEPGQIETTTNSVDTMVITATREGKSRSELAESVSVQDKEEIEAVSPSHPAELLNRVAGVHVNNLGGEGHMTSIRQPISTSGVYLFLEDGVPTRPTGFFNHNGLYEVNIPQAERVEVTKGPGSSLYGSDAIGGVINSVTEASPDYASGRVNLEGGEHGWKRALVSGGTNINDDHGMAFKLNLTDSDGYRDESEYQRYSTSLRFDGNLSSATSYKLIAAYTGVDQSGVSDLEEDDYKNNPTKNKYHGDIGFRDVSAFRLTGEIATELSDVSLLSFTPFYRDNTTKMMPSWMVTYDPNIRETHFQSFGLLSKYRYNFEQGELITGVDIDHTVSDYQEKQISVTKQGDIFTDYSETGRTHYDYDADQTSISPYVHGEWTPADNWRLVAGLRYDYFHLDYTDNLDRSVSEIIGRGRWLRPDSQSLDFNHLSPKLGAVYSFNQGHQTYANYRNAFRIPSVGQLFRSGSTVNTTDLKPVESDSFEIGFRGDLTESFGYDLTLYHMIVKNQVVSYIDGRDRKTTNAGKTQHQGIELSLAGDFSDEWAMNAGFTYNQQEYKAYQYIYSCYPPACVPPVVETRNYAGFDVGKAPNTMGNLAFQYAPLALDGLAIEVEWEHLGEYYTDETNTNKYQGHDLFNLRASYEISDRVMLRGRVMNLADTRYSTYTSNQVGNPNISYRPGAPRSFYLGIDAQF